MTEPRLLTLPEQLAILKAADSYAVAAARVKQAKERAKRMGDPVHVFDLQRQAARDRLVEILKEL